MNLQLDESGAKYWRMNYRSAGKDKTLADFRNTSYRNRVNDLTNSAGRCRRPRAQAAGPSLARTVVPTGLARDNAPTC